MHAKSLPIPSAVAKDSRAIELIRAWVSGERQHVSLATVVWDDPAAWGIFLVDLAKHIADSYQQLPGKEYTAALARIRTAFDAEWENATDVPFGRLEK